MPLFSNTATLSYDGLVTTSNTVTGNLQEALSLSKAAVRPSYAQGDDITYVISIVNTGAGPFDGLTVSDNLGNYPVGAGTVTPLAYQDGSLRYYINGVLQPTPTVTAGPPLTVSGLSVPVGGNAQLIYEATVNGFAPLAVGSTLTNTATLTGAELANPVTATAAVTPIEAADLSVSKSLFPSTVTENGQLTYTFVIQNSGNTPAGAADNVVLSDTFTPVLRNVAVTLNDQPLPNGTDYTYDAATGAFSTLPGQITVPAATYTQAEDGTVTVTPGVTTVTVTGTV